MIVDRFRPAPAAARARTATASIAATRTDDAASRHRSIRSASIREIVCTQRVARATTTRERQE